MFRNKLSLFLLPLWFLIILVSMFIIWYIWLGPGYEPGPVFPGEPQGQFIQPIIVDNDRGNIVAHWSVESVCKINEIEFKQQGEAIANSNSWGGGTADCVEGNGQFICQADLTDRGLVDDITYRLQATSNQCSNGERYVSEVVEFKY